MVMDSLYRCGEKTRAGSSEKPTGGAASKPRPDHRIDGSNMTRCPNPPGACDSALRMDAIIWW
jgi:hypothetical protein